MFYSGAHIFSSIFSFVFYFDFQAGAEEEPRKVIVFAPREVNLFIRLIKWALQAFDIYMMTVPGIIQGVRMTTQARSRSKEEIEVLEHFNGIVSKINLEYLKCKNIRF